MAKSSTASKLTVFMLAALAALGCGGRANEKATREGNAGGSLALGGQGNSGRTSGGVSTSGGATTSGGSTDVAGGALAGGAISSGGQPDVGDGWTLPHSSDTPWRNSGEPLCAPGGIGLPLDLWSDERGVWVVAETDTRTPSLSFNDGSGWSSVSHDQGNIWGIAGFEQGPLVLSGGSPCGLIFKDGDDETCGSVLPGIFDVFVVDESRTFAVAGDRVFAYNGSYLTQFGFLSNGGDPGSVQGLWADADVVIVVTAMDDQGTLYIFSEGEVESWPISDGAPSAMWAFDRRDVWIGLDENRLVHFNGSGFAVQPLDGLPCGNVAAMWGSEHVLFFASSTLVGKLESGTQATLARAMRCPTSDPFTAGRSEQLSFRKIWGNSPTEVFFALTESMIEVTQGSDSFMTTSTDPDSCGQQRIYWSDGKRLQPL